MKKVAIAAAIVGFTMLVLGWTSEAAAAAAQQATSASALNQDMRKLWTDHVVCTRDYIIAAAAEAPDQQAAAGRNAPALSRSLNRRNARAAVRASGAP